MNKLIIFCLQCDDETCKYTTRSLNLRLVGDSERGTVCPNYPRCNGRLVRKVYISNFSLEQCRFFFFFWSYNYYLPCIFCYGLNDVKLRMPEASLANNKDVMAITFFFFLFLDGLNNTLTNLLYFLGVECTLTSTRKQNCTSSSHTSAMCWMPYAA
jgi:hypothetical protein